MVAGFKSESRPASNRNPGRHQIGTRPGHQRARGQAEIPVVIGLSKIPKPCLKPAVARRAAFVLTLGPSQTDTEEDVMAKGQMRSNKEKKKPKAAQNEKRKGAPAATSSGFAGMQAKPSANPTGKKN